MSNSTEASLNAASKEDQLKIFISHSSDDKKYADLIEELLLRLGFKKTEIFYSSGTNYSEKVHPSEDIFNRLINEIDVGDHFIFLLSNSFYQSAACTAEVGGVWLKEHENKKDGRKRVDNSNGENNNPSEEVEVCKSIYSIFCVPEFSSSEIQQPLNRDLKAVMFNEEGLNLWVKEIICPLLKSKKRKIACNCSDIIKDVVGKYEKTKDKYGIIKIQGSSFHCQPVDNRLIRSIFTASDSEVFICDSDLRWLLKNNLLKVIKTELESRENFQNYLMLYSPENPIFRSPSLRENTQKIQIILNSMRKLLNFSKKNSGISERIHIRLNTTEPLLLNGFAKDMGIESIGEVPRTAEIYSTTHLYSEDMRNNPVLKITRKYSKDNFTLYKRYFQDMWMREDALSWRDLQIEYEQLLFAHNSNLSGGNLISSYRGTSSRNFIFNTEYVSDYERMFHYDDVRLLNRYEYMEQFRNILGIWEKEKRKLRADEQIVFLFERIILGSAFNPSLKDDAYYHFFEDIQMGESSESSSDEEYLQQILKTVNEYSCLSTSNIAKTPFQYIRIINSLKDNMGKAKISLDGTTKEELSVIIPIVSRNYLGLSFYQTASLLHKDDNLKFEDDIRRSIPEFDSVFDSKDRHAEMSKDDCVNYLLECAIQQYEIILKTLDEVAESSVVCDVLGSYVYFNLGRAYGFLLENCCMVPRKRRKGSRYSILRGFKRRKLVTRYKLKIYDSYSNAIKKRKEVSQHNSLPVSLRHYFSLETLYAMLDYTGRMKIDEDKKPRCREIRELWEEVVKQPFEDVKLFETVKVKYEEYEMRRMG